MGRHQRRLLEDKEISDALALYAVDQLYANVDVSRSVKQLRGRATDLGAHLGGNPPGRNPGGAAGAAVTACQAPGRTPTGRAPPADHGPQGDNEAVSEEARWVVLDLRPLVLQLADRVGLKKQLNEQLPPDVGQLEVADAKELDTARTITRRIEGLAWLFSIGTLALFATWRIWQGAALDGRARLRPRPDRGGLRRDRRAQRPRGCLRRLAFGDRGRERPARARLGHRDLTATASPAA